MTHKRISPSTPARNKQAPITQFAKKKLNQHLSPGSRQCPQETHISPQDIETEGMATNEGRGSEASEISSSTIKMANANQALEIVLESLDQQSMATEACLTLPNIFPKV
jgi:hypothetical protein